MLTIDVIIRWEDNGHIIYYPPCVTVCEMGGLLLNES